MSKLVGVLISYINTLHSIQNSDITTFGVKLPNVSLQHGLRGHGCGINYQTNTIYIIGGVIENYYHTNLDIVSYTHNPYYITWNRLNNTDWNNINDYSSITTPAFDTTLVNTSILTTIYPGYNGSWLCERYSCTIQINKSPYIYIIGTKSYNIQGDRVSSNKLLIFDMNNNDYVSLSKYKNTIPDPVQFVQGYIYIYIFVLSDNI